MAIPRFNEGLLALIFLWEIEDEELLQNDRALAELLVAAVNRVGMTTVGPPDSRAIPPGFSGWQCLMESHASYHTWPEDGALIIEIYSCRAFFVRDLVDWLRYRTRARRFDWQQLGGDSGFFALKGDSDDRD